TRRTCRRGPPRGRRGRPRCLRRDCRDRRRPGRGACGRVRRRPRRRQGRGRGMGRATRAAWRPRPGQGRPRSLPGNAGRTAVSPVTALALDAITFVVAFVIAVVLFPRFIELLRNRGARQVIQAELSEEHQRKAGVPTGGGILFIAVSILGGVLATAAG